VSAAPDAGPVAVRSPDRSGRRRALLIGTPLALSTGLKLWLALTTFGTNDVRYWNTFMSYIVAKGTVTIYRDIRFYNHPPAISGFLWLLHLVAGHVPHGFPFALRLPAILADVASALLTYRLVRFGWDERRAIICAVGVALSPILVMVSGFHGNTDPVFMCLVLLAADRALIGRSGAWAGAILGAAINVKLVPLLVVPIFFFHLAGARARARFAVALAGVIGIGFGYHFVVAGAFLRRNALEYSGLANIWGLTELARAGFPLISSPDYATALKRLIAALVVARAIALLRRRARGASTPEEDARGFLRSIGWAFLLFMLLTPGFGIQYLSWLAIAAYLLDPAWALGYNLFGGAFAFAVYHFWNRGFPWNVADSDVVGPWRAPQALLGRLTWLYLVIWVTVLIHTTVTRWRPAPPAPTTPS
jgi:hypothetical protein